MTRRTVGLDPQFSTALDAQLGEARDPNGEPSASDFLLIELPTIAGAFGERLMKYSASTRSERNDYRYLAAGSRLVYAVVVAGELIDDDTISLFGIEIDLRGPQ